MRRGTRFGKRRRAYEQARDKGGWGLFHRKY
jgi:hypothetical protein